MIDEYANGETHNNECRYSIAKKVENGFKNPACDLRKGTRRTDDYRFEQANIRLKMNV